MQAGFQWPSASTLPAQRAATRQAQSPPGRSSPSTGGEHRGSSCRQRPAFWGQRPRGPEGLRQRGLLVEPLQTSLLIGSLEGSALRARPDFRLTRGSRLRAASIRAAAKPISGQNHLAGEPVLSSQSWRPGRGRLPELGNPHTQPS